MALTNGYIPKVDGAVSGGYQPMEDAIEASAVTGHIADEANPHGVTAAQAGALAIASNLSDLDSAATARTNLAVYSSAQVDSAIDADISTHAALTQTHGISDYGASLVDDATAVDARSTLGLGTIATQDADDVNITGGTIADTTLLTPMDLYRDTIVEYVDLTLSALNIASEVTNYAKISAQPFTITDGFEDGLLHFYTMSGGALTEGLEIDQSSNVSLPNGNLYVNVIAEYSNNTGVTIEGVLIKDGVIDHSDIDGLGELATEDFTKLTRPNILINTNGADPINQREVSDGDALTNGNYTIDRWYVSHNYTGLAFENSSGGSGIKLTDVTAGNYALIFQSIENYSSYAGETLTLSAYVRSNDTNAKLSIRDGTNIFESDAYSSEGIMTVTATVDSSPAYLLLSIGLGTATVDKYIEFDWIKLEVGSERTLWVPPDPATELARCQRYYQRFGGQTYTSFGTVLYDSSTLGRLIVPAPVPMRTIPSLEYSGSFAFAYGDMTGTYSSMAISTTLSDEHIFAINVTGTSLSGAVARLFANNDADAYIAFDAEL